MNYINNGKTMLDKMHSDMKWVERYCNNNAEVKAFIKLAKDFVEFLKKAGCKTAKTERMCMEKRIPNMTLEELVRVSKI